MGIRSTFTARLWFIVWGISIIPALAGCSPHFYQRLSIGSQSLGSSPPTDQLVFSTEPSSPVESGSAFASQPVIEIENSDGDLLSSATNSVTLAAYTDPTCATSASGALIASSNPLAASSGIASFAGLKYTGATGTIYIGASATGLASACSSAITINAGSPAQIAFSAEPATTGPTGTAFTTQPVVQIQDASGNVVTSATNSITLAAYTNSTCTTAASGTFSATTNPLSATAGTASFSGVTYGSEGTIYIGASAGGFTSICSTEIIESYLLVFATQPPSNVAAGAALGTGPVVKIEDQSGNVVTTGSNSTVTITLTDSSGNGILGGTTSVAAVAGVATFSSNIEFEKGGSKTLTAKATLSDSSVVSAQSDSINVTIPSMSAISAFSGPNSPYGYVDSATASEARFSWAQDIVSDGTSIYVADHDNCLIRKYNISTGAVTDWVGSYRNCQSSDADGLLFYPFRLAIDSSYLYVAEDDDTLIRKIDLTTGAITTIAGQYFNTGHADSSTGTDAQFYGVRTMYVMGSTLYVGDQGQNHCYIRTVTLSGSYAVGTYAGSGTCATTNESTGTPLTAAFNGIYSLTADSSYLYVGDNGNVRRIDLGTGNVSTLYSPGDAPLAMSVISGELYFPVQYQYQFEEGSTGGGSLTAVAGQAWNEGWADGSGTSAAIAMLSSSQMVVDGSDLYFMDDQNGALRTLDTSNGSITTNTGNDFIGDSYGSSAGTSSTARYDIPGDIASDGTYLYVSDFYDDLFSVALGTGTSTVGTGSLSTPFGMLVVGSNLIVSQINNYTLAEVPISAYSVSTYAGNGTDGPTNSSLADSEFESPGDIVSDGIYYYVADNGSIRKIDPIAGSVSTLAGTTGSPGCLNGTESGAELGSAIRMAYLSGSIYFFDGCFGTALRSVDVSTGEVATYAGDGTAGDEDGTLAAAEFNTGFFDMNPGAAQMPSITSDGVNLYVLDPMNGAVRFVNIGAGTVSTLVGSSSMVGDTDGGVTATFGGTGTGRIGQWSRAIYYGFGKLYLVGDRNIRVVQ